MVDLIGRDLGRYHILEQLGEGGMATVYKAYDTRLERDVAVKVIRVDQFAPVVLDRILKRFEREAKALAHLTHPNIVHINDYGEQDGIPYLVMDFLPGGTLKQKLGAPMHWHQAVKLLLPIAEALDYAHSQDIVHRDVKPSNILLTQRGQPMLTDFGIAKILESEETTELTGTGVGMGTPEYMAPEQANARTADQRADIYSLGVVFYELVTGRKPYVADTPLAVLVKQSTEALPRPRQFIPDLPEAVEKVLFKALAKKPEDRYQNMGEFVAALEGLASGQTIKVGGELEEGRWKAEELTQLAGGAKREEEVTRLASGARRAEEQPPIIPIPPVSSPPKKSIWWVWLIGIVGILCLIMVVILARAVLLPLLQKTPQNNSPAILATNSPVPATNSPVPATNSPVPTEIVPETPSFTAIPQPRMFNFQACLEPCNGHNSQSSFPEKTTMIYFQWQYENIPVNSSYIRVMAQNGNAWARYDCTWPGPSTGIENKVRFTEPNGIQSGDWVLTVDINGVVLLQETINVQGNYLYWSPAGNFSTCYGVH